MSRLNVGDIVQHFKRETCVDNSQYVYKIIGFAKHTETGEELVVYQALYRNDSGVNYGIYCRPYDMFMSKVDHEKYPNIKQEYRFEKIADSVKSSEVVEPRVHDGSEVFLYLEGLMRWKEELYAQTCAINAQIDRILDVANKARQHGETSWHEHG